MTDRPVPAAPRSHRPHRGQGRGPPGGLRPALTPAAGGATKHRPGTDNKTNGACTQPLTLNIECQESTETDPPNINRRSSGPPPAHRRNPIHHRRFRHLSLPSEPRSQGIWASIGPGAPTPPSDHCSMVARRSRPGRHLVVAIARRSIPRPSPARGRMSGSGGCQHGRPNRCPG
jgi:hypothetical protein